MPFDRPCPNNRPPWGVPDERPVTVHPTFTCKLKGKTKLGTAHCPNNRPPPGRQGGRPVTDQGGHFYWGGVTEGAL